MLSPGRRGKGDCSKVNRVYAVSDKSKGTVYKTHAVTGRDAKVAGLPTHCAIDNNNNLSIEVVDRKWYVKLAKKYINDFWALSRPEKIPDGLTHSKRNL